MINLSRFFHFHEGAPEDRAVKIGGAFLAAFSLLLIAGAVTSISAQTPSPGSPTVSNIQATAEQHSATISWSTDIPAIGGLVWGTDSQEARRLAGRELSHVVSLDPNPLAAGSRSITITGLTEDTIHYFSIEMTSGRHDARGRELRTRSIEQTFRTRAAPGATTPPPPTPAVLQGCQDTITTGPTTRTLTPGVAGRCTRTAHESSHHAE